MEKEKGSVSNLSAKAPASRENNSSRRLSFKISKFRDSPPVPVLGVRRGDKGSVEDDEMELVDDDRELHVEAFSRVDGHFGM